MSFHRKADLTNDRWTNRVNMEIDRTQSTNEVRCIGRRTWKKSHSKSEASQIILSKWEQLGIWAQHYWPHLRTVRLDSTNCIYSPQFMSLSGGLANSNRSQRQQLQKLYYTEPTKGWDLFLPQRGKVSKDAANFTNPDMTDCTSCTMGDNLAHSNNNSYHFGQRVEFLLEKQLPIPIYIIW